MKTDNAQITNSQRDTGLQESHANDGKAENGVVRHAKVSLAEAGVAAKGLADQGRDAVRKGSERVEGAALRISDGASNYVWQHPLKALLIAAASGALIAVAAGIASRRR